MYQLWLDYDYSVNENLWLQLDYDYSLNKIHDYDYNYDFRLFAIDYNRLLLRDYDYSKSGPVYKLWMVIKSYLVGYMFLSMAKIFVNFIAFSAVQMYKNEINRNSLYRL